MCVCVGLNFPTFTKVVLAVLGVDVGQPRPPLSPYSDAVKDAVAKDLQDLGFSEWSIV